MSDNKQRVKILTADHKDDIQRKINNNYPGYYLDEMKIKPHEFGVAFVAVMKHKTVD